VKTFKEKTRYREKIGHEREVASQTVLRTRPSGQQWRVFSYRNISIPEGPAAPLFRAEEHILGVKKPWKHHTSELLQTSVCVLKEINLFSSLFPDQIHINFIFLYVFLMLCAFNFVTFCNYVRNVHRCVSSENKELLWK